MKLRLLLYMVLLCCVMQSLSACSAGSPGRDALLLQQPSTFSNETQALFAAIRENGTLQRTIIERAKASPHVSNTVFAYPGMLMVIDWGRRRAGDAAKFLVEQKLAGDALRSTTRDGSDTLERLLQEDGTGYLGIHYSLGAAPKVVQASLDAIAKASQKRQEKIVYHPILVEPFQFSDLDTKVRLDSPHLGSLYAVVSQEYSFLRPNLQTASRELLAHPKIHILTAEDFGVNWGHFTFLGDVRKPDEGLSSLERRSKEIFTLLAALPLSGVSHEAVTFSLHWLKCQYALEDGRPLHPKWVDVVLAGREEFAWLTGEVLGKPAFEANATTPDAQAEPQSGDVPPQVNATNTP